QHITVTPPLFPSPWSRAGVSHGGSPDHASLRRCQSALSDWISDGLGAEPGEPPPITDVPLTSQITAWPLLVLYQRSRWCRRRCIRGVGDRPTRARRAGRSRRHLIAAPAMRPAGVHRAASKQGALRNITVSASALRDIARSTSSRRR